MLTGIRKQRYEAGLCIQCGERPAETKYDCGPCADVKNERSKAYHRSRYKKKRIGRLNQSSYVPPKEIDYSWVELAQR
jgi:hypothetical protein